jgi:citrate lyase subunit beta/citryl-CoA lyase
MRLRSLLFVPGDRPDRMVKALDSGADALILDLEDSVLPEQKAAAREHVAHFLATTQTPLAIFVRINPLIGADAALDIAALHALLPAGIVLPKSDSADTVRQALALLGADIPILPIATETPAAIFGLGSYGSISAHLCGLTWGAEDLPAAIGATTSRLPDGRYTPPYEMVRSLALFGAHAAGVPAIETVFPDFRNLEGLAVYAAGARRDGFTGMMAIHPSQVPVINAAFQPTDAEIAWARYVLRAFADNPGAGAVRLDGAMLDGPHFKSARALLALAGEEETAP